MSLLLSSLESKYLYRGGSKAIELVEACDKMRFSSIDAELLRSQEHLP